MTGYGILGAMKLRMTKPKPSSAPTLGKQGSTAELGVTLFANEIPKLRRSHWLRKHQSIEELWAIRDQQLHHKSREVLRQNIRRCSKDLRSDKRRVHHMCAIHR